MPVNFTSDIPFRLARPDVEGFTVRPPVNPDIDDILETITAFIPSRIPYFTWQQRRARSCFRGRI
jgi:hypothetical protein